MKYVFKRSLIVCTLVLIMCMIGITSCQGEVIITSPVSGIYDTEIINIQVSTIGNYSNTQLIYAKNPQMPEDLYEFADMYVSLEKDLSLWKDGIHIFAARAYNVDSDEWDWSDNVSIKVDHSSIQEDVPAMRIIGLSKGMTISENKTRLISVVDNQTGYPIQDVTIYIMQDASTLCNSFITTISGMVKVKFEDYNGMPLDNDIYFVRFEQQGYETIEFEIDIEIKKKEVQKAELIIWGLDRIYNSDIESTELIRVKGSNTNEYLPDVTMKIIHADGTPITGSKTSSNYGTIDFSVNGIDSGKYSVVFEHPDYDTKIVNIEISKTPTASLTPTPKPTPIFNWEGFTFPNPHSVTLSDGTYKTYTSASEYSRDFERVNGETVERIKKDVPEMSRDEIINDHSDDGFKFPWNIAFGIILIISAVVWRIGPDKIRSIVNNKPVELPEVQNQDEVNMNFKESIVNDSKDEPISVLESIVDEEEKQ